MNEAAAVSLMMFASAMVVFQIVNICEDIKDLKTAMGNSSSCEIKDEAAWALSAGVVSFAIGGILLLLWFFAPAGYETSATPTAVFLFVWWIPGAFVSTYIGPFFPTSLNGYFGAWGAFAFSFILMYMRVTKLRRFGAVSNTATLEIQKPNHKADRTDDQQDDESFDDI